MPDDEGEPSGDAPEPEPAIETATETTIEAAPSTEPSPVDDAAPQARLPRLQSRPTVRLDPKDLRPSWPIVIAYLEQLSDWTVLALRLGTLALIQSCVRDLADHDAPAASIIRLRELVEALAHMPLEA